MLHVDIETKDIVPTHRHHIYSVALLVRQNSKA